MVARTSLDASVEFAQAIASMHTILRGGPAIASAFGDHPMCWRLAQRSPRRWSGDATLTIGNPDQQSVRGCCAAPHIGLDEGEAVQRLTATVLTPTLHHAAVHLDRGRGERSRTARSLGSVDSGNGCAAPRRFTVMHSATSAPSIAAVAHAAAGPVRCSVGHAGARSGLLAPEDEPRAASSRHEAEEPSGEHEDAVLEADEVVEV